MSWGSVGCGYQEVQKVDVSSSGPKAMRLAVHFCVGLGKVGGGMGGSLKEGGSSQFQLTETVCQTWLLCHHSLELSKPAPMLRSQKCVAEIH